MKRPFHTFLLLAIAIALTRVPDADSQTGTARVGLLDRTGQENTAILDGDQGRVRRKRFRGRAVD